MNGGGSPRDPKKVPKKSQCGATKDRPGPTKNNPAAPAFFCPTHGKGRPRNRKKKKGLGMGEHLAVPAGCGEGATGAGEWTSPGQSRG